MYCTCCGARFPDYVVATTGRKRGGATKKIKIKSSPIQKSSKMSSPSIQSLESAMRGESAGHPRAHAASGVKNRKPLVLALSLLVAIALAAAGSGIYLKKKAEREFIKTFVLTAYCIQTGQERSLKASQKMAGEWKARMSAGQAYKARLSAEDEKAIRLIMTRIDSFRGSLKEEPEKFGHSSEKLAALENSYNKLRVAVFSPGDSLQSFTDTSSKLDAEYQAAARDFKAGLPEELKKALQSASKKYKGLRPLAD